MIIKGKLINAKRELKEFNGRKEEKEKLYITLAEVDETSIDWDAVNECYKDSGKKFTPDWVKDFKGYVNLSTAYPLPAKYPDGTINNSLEDLIKDFAWLGAEVKLSCAIKEGAIYPNAIVFVGEGREFNPFAEFDNETED